MTKRAKGFELMKIIFIIHLNTWLKNVFGLETYENFENVDLIKVVHICDREHEHIIYMI
jgi:hypothetical protein